MKQRASPLQIVGLRVEGRQLANRRGPVPSMPTQRVFRAILDEGPAEVQSEPQRGGGPASHCNGVHVLSVALHCFALLFDEAMVKKTTTELKSGKGRMVEAEDPPDYTPSPQWRHAQQSGKEYRVKRKCGEADGGVVQAGCSCMATESGEAPICPKNLLATGLGAGRGPREGGQVLFFVLQQVDAPPVHP